MDYRDGEIIGLNPDGTIIQWNADDQQPYSPGETPEQFGLNNLTAKEARCLYDALPTSASPEDFKAGHGNWGLTEAESILAKALTEVIFR
jgi:hypothetical protein